MFVSTKTLIACFAPLALAQYGPPAGGGGSSSSTAPPQASTTAPTSPSTTASANPGVQTIVVGANNALTFNPNSTTAAVGTTVEFQFPGALVHSVVEGSFANPCVPANGSAFFSGGLSSASPNVFTLTINDTNPIWYFCGAPSHCGLGMVGVINPPSTQTVAEFAAAAAMVSSPPTITLPVEGGTIGPANAAVAPASSSSSTSSAAATSSTAKSVAARGMDTGGSTQWVVLALTGMAALCVGGLIM